MDIVSGSGISDGATIRLERSRFSMPPWVEEAIQRGFGLSQKNSGLRKLDYIALLFHSALYNFFTLTYQEETSRRVVSSFLIL